METIISLIFFYSKDISPFGRAKKICPFNGKKYQTAHKGIKGISLLIIVYYAITKEQLFQKLPLGWGVGGRSFKDMFIKQFNLGEYANFCYLLADEQAKMCAVIDPPAGAAAVIGEINSRGYKLIYLINTHDHFDHTAGNKEVIAALGAKTGEKVRVVLHSSSPLAELKADDGDVLPLGSLKLKILHTPGHTGDSICILVKEHLFTGDTLFVGKVGGTNTRESALVQFQSLRRLMKLADNITVWPGHDYGVKRNSTIKEERENNPFCQRLKDFADFYHLKENWLTYKEQHGIV
jgi:glyoxylase-like metal-dependent hydrolase (beta-lactamase superfamily II)